MKKFLTYIITLAVFCTIPTSTLANENQNISTEKVVISKTPYILRLTMLLIQNLNTEYDFNKIEKFAKETVLKSSEGDKNAKPDIHYARSKNNSSILNLLVNENSYYTAQYVIDENVSYKAGSKNYDEIVKYIKNNINPNFNINDYEIREEDFDIGEKITNILFTYTFKGIRSNFKYSVNVNEDGNVILISQIGEDLSTYEPTGEEKINEDTDEILKMARDKIKNKDNIESQSLTKRFDSKTKKVIYKVNTIVGSDDTGYDNVVFEYIP